VPLPWAWSGRKRPLPSYPLLFEEGASLTLLIKNLPPDGVDTFPGGWHSYGNIGVDWMNRSKPRGAVKI